ncbi:MAG: ribonuclease HII [Alphaproteobacteria bacterium]|nr:ribonuclease HII [Alphaproteobacteria bacterium]
MPDYSLEAAIPGRVAGVDEAGRGPWAGPVVAAAAILDVDALPGDLLAALDDSKKLKAEKRRQLLDALNHRFGTGIVYGVGVATVEEIDALNILQATMIAMTRAVDRLDPQPDMALIDGNRVPDALSCRARAVVKGDGLSLSIAAASIIAKVTRDEMMAKLAAEYPGYGWEGNAGYGTRAHQDAIASLGITPHHRKSFAPIRKILSPGDS